MIKFISTIVLVSGFSIYKSYAGGVSGYVTSTENEQIEFATIYVEEIGSGSSTNIEGFFQITLSPGTYNLVFQHLGFKAKVVLVEVGNSFTTLNVVLEPEAIMLKTVLVQAINEDPAYTIMRKAITKAKYHKQQLNTFEAELYIKGSARLIDSPFFLRKAMKKEGIDSTASYTIESVSKIKYTRPNTYEEEVISIRSTGEDNGTSPNSFIFGSFYNPKYVNAISPLSPKAFAYYKFEYLGTKMERGHEISKIKVTPRSMGDAVFWGEISIVEDIWSIQSTNLNVQNLGIVFNVKQIYEPIEPNVWLPISHKFQVRGKYFGFKFEGNYLSTIGKYKITLNEDLIQEIVIIDENIETEVAAKLEKRSFSEFDSTLAQGGELTRKQFRELINAYEKEEVKKGEEPLVVSTYTIKIDSLAANSDSTFWAQLRPVPLTKYEIKGYHKMDSAVIAKKAEAEADTLIKNRSGKFQIMDALTIYTFKLGENDRLTYYSPAMLFYYNTIEGFNAALKFKYVHTFENKTKLFIEPVTKYGFSSERFYGKVGSTFRYGLTYKRSSLGLNAGIYNNQLNTENPITPLVSTITSIFWKGNYLKLYEASYVSATNRGYFSDRLSYSIGASVEKRSPLQNTNGYTWSKKSQEYSSNAPDNIEVANTDFVAHHALLINAGIAYKPWLKFRIRNGIKYPENASSPIFDILYKSGVPVFSSNNLADFNQIEIGYKQSFRPGIKGQFFIDARAGGFINKKPQVFTDFKHFAGNESSFLMEDPVGSYRLLPYYYYSTSDKYVSAQVLYQFRKFIFTQLPVLRLIGLKELAYLSYLGTPSLGNYFEVGYGFDNLLRIFRAEAAVSFNDGLYMGIGFKIGLATSISTGDGSLQIGL